jgi:hypothetical protein
LKKLLKSNTFLFKLWFHLYRKKKGLKPSYFNENTKFYLDGYPRSGNTFAVSLTSDIYGRESIAHHLHAIAPIKIALKKKIPVFILVRDPKEVITSYYLKTYALKHEIPPKEINHNLLKKLTVEYSNYYDFVIKNKFNLETIFFKDLINNPLNFISKINSKVFNHSVKLGSFKIDSLVDNYRGANDTFGSSKPNKAKEKLKKDLKSVLFELEEYRRAKSLFNKINN